MPVFADMDFLFKDRGSGKRTIKPSKDSEQLEAVSASHSPSSAHSLSPPHPSPLHPR